MFFFSSRRRHTRLQGDWSSDVCSSDLGQMYGPIIYQKAPIVMRQLEMMVGEEPFRAAMREYLRRYAFGNATWLDLVRILDARSEERRVGKGGEQGGAGLREERSECTAD